MTSVLRRISNNIINIGVVALAALPLIFFSAKPWNNRAENRHSAPPPAWPQTVKEWKRFPAAFEAFFNDSFGLRAPMITMRNYIDYYGLGKSPITLVMRGRKHWLFYVGANSLQDYMGRPVMGDDDVQAWKKSLQTRHDLLAARGIPYYFVIVPNKQSIYPEYMEPAIYHGRLHNADRVLAAIAGPTGRPIPWIIDLRPALLAAKGGQAMFELLDVHWNQFGAYIAYEAVMQALLRDRIAASKIAIPHGRFVITHDFPGGDLDDMLGLHSDRRFVTSVRYNGPALPCATAVPAATVPGIRIQPWQGIDIERSCPQAGNATAALIFNDSMMDALHPYFDASFGHTRYVWSYPPTDDMLRYANAAHPSIVIEERVERAMITPPPSDAPPHG